MTETPFLNSEAGHPVSLVTPPPARFETPFLSEYLSADEEFTNPLDEMADEMLESLHDEELDEAIAELTEELRGWVASGPLSESEHDDLREATLQEAMAPLIRAAEADMARVAHALEALDLGLATESEMEAAIGAAPVTEVGNPVFENFLGSLRRAVVGKIAKVAKAVGQAALGPVVKALLGQLARFVRPLLLKIAKFALNKVPAAYRPLATALAARLGVSVPSAAVVPQGTDASAPAEPASAPGLDEPAVPDTSQAQQEFDLAMAEVALGGGRVDHEVVGTAVPDAAISARDPYADLGRARARFVREITEARSVEEAQVVVERFAPVLLMAVRKGIGLIGRPKVVNAFGGLIAKFIGPLVGRANAPALGKVLADIGLRTFLHAEVGPEAEREAAGQALAATVEETVRRLAQLPERLLEEPEALAAYAREAFENAVAANFPATLVRPELRETETPGAWVSLPLQGRPVCRKFSHVFDAVVSPQVAPRLRGYGSSTVAGLFRDRLRLAPGATVNARLHLYEAVPGTTLAGIARMEEAHGLGSAETSVWSQIQPLTPEAASLLVGSPRLGRELPDDAEPAVPRLGQRFYYLEVAGGPPRPLGKESAVRVAVDLRKGEVRLGLYLSEVVAQKVAAALRTKTAPATVVADLRALLAPTTGAIGHAPRLVRVYGVRRHGSARLRAGAAGKGARRALRRQIGDLALHWAWKHLAANLPAIAPDFIAKADGPEDGVRLGFGFQVADGLAGVAKLFRGRGLPGSDWPPQAPTRVTLAIHSGPRNG